MNLNLLVALKALLDEKHVSRAANRVGLSQPAMSRALGRLRKMLNDPLLVKSSQGLCVTDRANHLYQSLQNIFLEIDQIITPPSVIPEKLDTEFVIATRDYETITVLPSLIKRLSKEAPNLKLRVISLIGDDLSLLDKHEVDVIIAGTVSSSATLCRQTLFQDKFGCLLSANLQINQAEFSLDKFLAMKHCLVSITGVGPGIVDEILAKKSLQRNVVLKIPHFLATGFLVADTDLVVTLPYRMGALLAQHEKIQLLNPPFNIPFFPIYLYWHIKNQNNPIHKWFRNIIKEVSPHFDSAPVI